MDHYYIPTRDEFKNVLEMRHTKAVQDKLSAARVAVCGLGGLGSNIAIALARTGIGRLHLIDFDRVDLANLNRQQYFVSQIGKPKTEALKETLHAFAPYTEIVTDYVKITEDNAGTLLADSDYICEAFDRADQKAMLVNYVLSNMPDKYLIGGSGMAGYGKSNSIKTRERMKKFYLCGDGETEICDEYGLMAPRVMLCAAHQANLVVSLIVGAPLRNTEDL